MLTEKFDVRCVLLCKTFQAKYDVYDKVFSLLKTSIGDSLEHYVSLGEYDGLFTCQINSDNNLLLEISKNNKIFAEKMADSLFFRPLYLIFPRSDGINKVDNFWGAEDPFFFVSIVHTNNCCANFKYKTTGRDKIIEIIDKIKKINNWSFKYRVYYSLDLSDYVILWKATEPAYILGAMKYLHEYTNIVGYTNTIYSLPRKAIDSDTLESSENVKFALTIQAVATSYKSVRDAHERVVSLMNEKHNVKTNPYFSFGNDDYLGFFSGVTAQEFFDLHKAILKDNYFKDAILSLNTTISIDAYETSKTELTKPHDYCVVDDPLKMKERLQKDCHNLKECFIKLLSEDLKDLPQLYWKKPIYELLVLLDNMSKSTVFDSVCFLFLDSVHLFYEYLFHLKNVENSNEKLYKALIDKELEIETFIREWEQLADHVVRIDGTFQRTPGYESLNYNMSASIVEYNNAYAQKLIDYFTLIDMKENDGCRVPKLASFVVPKICRRFKTAQLFYDSKSMDSLLFITIPVSQMYESFNIMTSLTHEISHYCSDAVRLRNKRAEALITCVSILVCYQLNVFSNQTIKKCGEILKDLFAKNGFDTNNDSYYLNYLVDIKADLKTNVFKLLNKTENLQKLHSQYCKDYEKYNNTSIDRTSLAIEMKRESSYMLGNPADDIGYTTIYEQVEDIASLFKEGYADLMMIYVLSLSPKEYFKAIFSDIGQLDMLDEKGKMSLKFQRVIIVCKSLVDLGEWDENFFDFIVDDFSEKEYYHMYIKIYDAWLSDEFFDEDLETYFYHKDVIEVIINYLKECYQEIKNREVINNQTDSRKYIEKAFRDMINGDENSLFSEGYQNVLQHNREKILFRWENRKDSPFLFR